MFLPMVYLFYYTCVGGGLIGYGIGHMQGLHGLSAWQWCSK